MKFHIIFYLHNFFCDPHTEHFQIGRYGFKFKFKFKFKFLSFLNFFFMKKHFCIVAGNTEHSNPDPYHPQGAAGEMIRIRGAATSFIFPGPITGVHSDSNYVCYLNSQSNG